LKYGAMVAVGAYFCVIIDKHKIEDILNIRRVDKKLPFILNDCAEEQDLNPKKHLFGSFDCRYVGHPSQFSPLFC